MRIGLLSAIRKVSNYVLIEIVEINVKVEYDLTSLIKSKSIYEIDPDLVDRAISDERFLNISRVRAETKLIKLKIIHKVYHDMELSPEENEYFKLWKKDLLENRDILSARDSMVPPSHSRIKIEQFSPADFYTLNSLANVEFLRDTHGQYSANEIFLELSHILDEEVVDKTQMEILSQSLKVTWGLPEDFKVVETRNKEIDLVLDFAEEQAWRESGEFTSEEVQHMKNMLSIKRGKDTIDRDYVSPLQTDNLV